MFERMRKKNLGQSLLEVIVAIGVVLSVLISISGLVAINVFGQKSSENRVLASQLAREAIEVVRNYRDQATLQKITLSQAEGEYSPAAHYYTLKDFNGDLDNRWKLFTNDNSWDIDTEVKLNNNFYNDSSSGSYTSFKRRMIIDTICSDSGKCTVVGAAGICEDGEADNCVVANTSGYIGYRVTSQVQWLENNQTQNLQLVDFLYDWR